MKNFLSVCFTILSAFIAVSVITYYKNQTKLEQRKKWEQRNQINEDFSKISNIYSGCWVNKEEDNDFFELRLSNSNASDKLVINRLTKLILRPTSDTILMDAPTALSRLANRRFIEKQEEYGNIPHNSRSKVFESLKLLSDPSGTPYISSELIYVGKEDSSSAEKMLTIKKAVYEKNDDICSNIE